jgi:peptidoglycan/LPS O-acetylase OafA/YrhL
LLPLKDKNCLTTFPKFGIFRLILATLVVLTHLGKINPAAGGYAVFGFYMLSGYLISLVLNESYLKKRNGILKFYLNRFLKIFPPFLFVTIISALTLCFCTSARQPIFRVMHNPDSWTGWISNLTLLDYMNMYGKLSPQVQNYQIVPVGWTLWVEWVFYLLMPFLTSNKNRVLLWMICSIAYTVIAVTSGFPYEMRYNSPLAASLPFSIGCFIYHFLPRIPPVSGRVICCLMTVFIIHAVSKVYHEPMVAGLYLSVLLSGCLIVSLARSRVFASRMACVDGFCGDISYSVFLCHFWVGLCVTLLFPTLRAQSNAFLFTALPFVFVCSFVVFKSAEFPLVSLRAHIKNSRY